MHTGSSLRLFVGVALPRQVRAELLQALEPQRALFTPALALRWVAPEQWHLTLQFLGSVKAVQCDSVAAACALAASRVAPFELQLDLASAFRSPRAATTIWQGASAGATQLIQLADSVMAATAGLGFAPEARPYHAHLTLARLKQPRDVREPLARMQLPAQRFAIKELTLFRSHLGAAGARYEPLGHYTLREPRAPAGR